MGARTRFPPTTMGSSFQRACSRTPLERGSRTRCAGYWLESACVQVIYKRVSTGSQKMCTRSRTGGQEKHSHCLNVVGRRWTQSTSKMFSRSGSEFNKAVLTSSRGGSAMLPEWHCKNDTMLLSQVIIRGRSARGKRSLCFPSCCCDALRANGTWRRMSCARFDKFGAGQWAELLEEAQNSVASSHNRIPTEDTMERRADAALRKVKVGEVSRARQCLTGATLAPGTEETFHRMQSRRPQVETRALPQEVHDFQPDTPLTVDRKVFLQCLKSAPRGASPGPGGCTYEHLKLLLEDTDTVELPLEAVTSLARASVPVEVTRALMSARLTALTKPDGGIRGIATGCALRRLVARILARQYMKEFESECARFQYALSTRAGTDCVGHLLRAATDADPQATILSVDGVGGYDHVLRSTMLERLMHMPTAKAMLPFVRLSNGTPSRYADRSHSRVFVKKKKNVNHFRIARSMSAQYTAS